MGSLWPGYEQDLSPGSPAGAQRLGQLVRKLAGAPRTVDAPELPPPPRSLDPARILDEVGTGLPEAIIDALLATHLTGGVRPEARAKLVAFVAQGRPVGAALARRVREAVHAIMTMTEYQLA